MKRATHKQPSANSSGQSGKRRATRGSRLAAAAGVAPEGSVVGIQSSRTASAAGTDDKSFIQQHRSGSGSGDGSTTAVVPSATAAGAAGARRTQRVTSTKGPPKAPPPRHSRKCAASSSATSTTREATGNVAACASASPPPATAAAASKKGRTAAVAASSWRGECVSEHAGDGAGVGSALVGGGETAMLATLLSPAGGQQNRERPLETEERTTAASPPDEEGDVDSSCPLEAIFLALEQVLPLFRRRRQATLFKQVRAAVEGMCGRSFTRQHLAQIVLVQPDAYKLSSKTDARPTRGGYRLRDILIEVGPRADAGSHGSETNNQSGDLSPQGAVDVAEKNGRAGSGSRDGGSRAGGGAVSVRRKEAFHDLLTAARARHCKCTADSTGDRRTRECSCLPAAHLPDTSPLRVDGDRCRIAGGPEFLGEMGAEVRPPVGRQSIYGGDTGGCCDFEGRDAPKDMAALRERLRQKDVLSALERNKTAEEKEADRRRKGNLPALADAVRSFFAHSGRTTCSLDALVGALLDSSRHALSTKEARDRIRMLADVVPEWCTVVGPPTAGRGSGGGDNGVGNGMLARPVKAKEVVRVNARIRYAEVRQMIVFMAGGSGGGGGGAR